MSFSFNAIGTHWQIDLPDELGGADQKIAEKGIRERIGTFDKTYSRFRTDSLVSEMAQRGGVYEFPSDAEPMFALYRKLYEITGGAFTPLIGQVLVDAGYDPQYSLKPRVLHAPPAWDDAMEWNNPILTVKNPVQLDFGAAGKGYLIDLVAEVIEGFGIHSYCIDAGGDILVRNAEGKPLRIGLENPQDTSQVIGVASVVNQSICGSAGNRRAWADFHHTINPHTLTSPRDIVAIWTVTDTTLIADALSTGLFFVPALLLRAEFDFEYLLINKDFSVEKSPQFPAELFFN